MLKPEQIPDDVAFALLDIYALWLGDTDQARAAIAAALAAWPGAAVCQYVIAEHEGYEMVLPLPLPKENGDE